MSWRAVKLAVRRKRIFTEDQVEDTKLRRCLNLWDLSLLGIGSTVGVGVFVLVGSAAVQLAGPSVIVSVLVAALAALFAGLCYAEFGARVPRAGAPYIFAYVTLGEMAAFWIGWINIFEYIFCAASIARGLSTYVDWATNYTMGEWFMATMPIGGSFLAPHFDLFAFGIVVLLGVLIAIGVRESAMINNVLAVVTLLTIVFVVIAGATFADTTNWKIPVHNVPEGLGSGGFFPYGVWGMMHGAAVCFCGFVGFDTISFAGEEAIKPRSSIPVTILTVLPVAFLAYAAVAAVVTMMVPYYLMTSVTEVFSQVNLGWAMWVVTGGAVCGITSSMFGALFSLPRLLYSMASDGLFFQCFAHVASWRQSPVLATLVSTAVIASVAGVLELQQLIMMISVGTLISHTVVAASVILLRYRSVNFSIVDAPSTFRQIVGFGEKKPSHATSFIVEAVLLLFLVACAASALVVKHARHPLVPAAVVNVLALLLIIVMMLQPRTTPELAFKTPLVPIIPCLSIYVNIHLMLFIGAGTWLRIATWILIGIPFYIIFMCCYKRTKNNILVEHLTLTHASTNGKSPVQIVVESPTPSDTLNRNNNNICRTIEFHEKDYEITEMQEKLNPDEITPYKTEEVIIQHAAYLENEEKEAKIIDMLDKVLQAEEDSYGEIISLVDPKEENDAVSAAVVHRKSLSELSDAESDASLGNHVLSKYDVIAQVHREDLPIVTEEKIDKGEADILENNNEIKDELITIFNDSETASRTDESGYSDTTDNIVPKITDESIEIAPNIPTPPPFDETYFSSPNFIKSHTVPKGPSRIKSVEQIEESKPRESIQSNGSQSDGTITFGSDRQINFMSKLNNIFQKQMTANPAEDEGEEKRRRSNSTGNVVDPKEFSINQERPTFFADLKKEIMLGNAAQNLRPVRIETKENSVPNSEETITSNDNNEEQEEISMSRHDLKSKLESIFANGGPQLLKPRLMKSNPPTPEEAYQTDTSSTESIAKLPKIEKNDTLKRQKDRFGAVLNSLNRLSLNKEDVV